jgi:hypothetical protein
MEKARPKTVADYLIEGGFKGRKFRNVNWSEKIVYYEILDLRISPNHTWGICCPIEYRDRQGKRYRAHTELWHILNDEEFIENSISTS